MVQAVVSFINQQKTILKTVKLAFFSTENAKTGRAAYLSRKRIKSNSIFTLFCKSFSQRTLSQVKTFISFCALKLVFSLLYKIIS